MIFLAKEKEEEKVREEESTRPVPAPVEVVGDAGYLVKYQYGQQPSSTGNMLEAPGDARLQEKSKNSQLQVRFPQQEEAVQPRNQQNFITTNGQHSQLSKPRLNLQELFKGEIKTSNASPVRSDNLAQHKEKARIVGKEDIIHEKKKVEGKTKIEAIKTDKIEKDTGTHYTYSVQQYFDTPYQSTSYYLSNKKPSNPENSPPNAPDVNEPPSRELHPTEGHDAGKGNDVGLSPILSSIGKTFTGETYVARSHGETRPRQGIAPAVTNGGGTGANILTSGISDSTGGRKESPIQILSKLIFPSNNFDKEISNPQGPLSKMPILAGEKELRPESVSPKETLEYKWRRQKDQPSRQERPETDYYPPVEEATSQERPDTGHSGLYAYEDWMAQAVRSREN